MNLFVLRTWLEAKFAKDEEGASLVEYILLVALIALAVIAAVVFLRNQVSGQVQRRRQQAQHQRLSDRPRDTSAGSRSAGTPRDRVTPGASTPILVGAKERKGAA